MKRKWIAILTVFVLALTLAACGAEEETTLIGMVVSVDGTVISLMEMDAENMSGMDFSGGDWSEMPEGMEGFGGFNSGEFDGTMPEGGSFPQWGEGEMPDGMEIPEGMDFPEDMTMPENGNMPNFGGNGGGMPNFGGDGGMDFSNFSSDAETKQIDIGSAHISVEIDGGKASGSMDDIQAGTFVTVTVNGKGEATYVLVTSQSVFGGNRMPGN